MTSGEWTQETLFTGCCRRRLGGAALAGPSVQSSGGQMVSEGVAPGRSPDTLVVKAKWGL